MPAPYSSKEVANTFIEVAKLHGQELTNMQIQKLVYLAHGFHLAMKDEPLVKDEVKAWTFGPVIPPLYNALKRFGNTVVNIPIGGAAIIPAEDVFARKLIEKVFSLYGAQTGAQLSALTHLPNSPWEQVFTKAKFSDIPTSLIRDYYRTKLKPAQAAPVG